MNSPTSPHRRYFRRNTRRLTSHQSVSAYCLPESQIDPGSNLSLESFITRSKPASITLEGADSNGNANSLDEFQIGSEKGRVSFGTVRVHKHNNVLGNNPSCSRGLPVELDWNHCESQTFHVDAFEEIQSANPKGAIRIHPHDREHILRLKGHSQESFQNVLLEIDSIKISREAAVDESPGGSLERGDEATGKSKDANLDQHVKMNTQEMEEYLLMTGTSGGRKGRRDRMTIEGKTQVQPKMNLVRKVFGWR